MLGLEDDRGMALLIQPMIDAECAGVCFSLDPVRPDTGRAVINATWGLGPGVVDATAVADTVWVRRDNQTVDDRHIVEKPDQVVLRPQGGVALTRVSPERRRAACLPDEWATRIAQFALAAEALFGPPQDTEWAIADGRVWLLQSRPIASLPAEYTRRALFPVDELDETDRRRLWSLDRLSGQTRDLLTPLERDEIAANEEMREETCQFLGADRNQAMRVVNGRIYFARIPLNISDGDRRVRRQAFQDLGERLYVQGLTPWQHWGLEIIAATERLAAFNLAGASDAELATHLEDALAARRRHYMLHPICSKMDHRPHVRAFEAISGLSGTEAEAAAYQLLTSDESMLTRLLDDCYRLAQLARGDAVLYALVAERPADLVSRLAGAPGPAADAFRAALDQFMARYGDRTGAGWGSEATVLTPTLREQPDEALHLVSLYLSPDAASPHETRQRAIAARNERVEALCEAAQPEAADEFRRRLAYACRLSSGLEDHNHYIDQLSVGQLRRAVLAAADRLTARGALPQRDDVFWLRFSEIVAALKSEATDGLSEVVRARRADHERWAEMEAPPLLGMPDASLPERPPLQDEVSQLEPGAAQLLRGQGASSGRYMGIARVALHPSQLPSLNVGDILVAENAGPLWTPYFPILGGLVLDSGSLGQHPAATAREYGIPAVVNTRHATQRIPDGATILIDGAAGTVEIQPDR